jgi:multimeric flavodoxin WrbA
MKKILGIIASPRGTGNSVTMAREVCRNVPVGHELSLLRLTDFNIEPCRGCYRCLLGEKGCVIKDDAGFIINRMEEADAYIISVPTYFLGANGILKLFLDRGLMFYGHGERLWGKPSIGIGIAGIEGKEGTTHLDLVRFQKALLADVKDTVILYGALPGEVFLNEENKKSAAELGKMLFGESRAPGSPVCPLCGGDTFRFLDEENVRCMLCSNRGRVSFRSGSPEFLIEKDGHELFLSRENAREHEKWLVEMKERYLEQKDELGKITKEYISDGKWIRPGKE